MMIKDPFTHVLNPFVTVKKEKCSFEFKKSYDQVYPSAIPCFKFYRQASIHILWRYLLFQECIMLLYRFINIFFFT